MRLLEIVSVLALASVAALLFHNGYVHEYDDRKRSLLKIGFAVGLFAISLWLWMSLAPSA